MGVFFWLNQMFLDGYRKIMGIKDLYPLDNSLSGKTLHDEFSRHMDYSKLKGDKFGLVKVLIRTLKVPSCCPCLRAWRTLVSHFASRFFIEKLLDHLSEPVVDANVGYGFIGASVLIYSGIAISTASLLV